MHSRIWAEESSVPESLATSRKCMAGSRQEWLSLFTLSFEVWNDAEGSIPLSGPAGYAPDARSLWAS